MERYRFLLLLDTDKIKDYVFASSKLKEVRGASRLLDYLNRDVSRRIIYQSFGLPDDFSKDEHERFRIVYLGGGAGKVEFVSREDAIRCGEEIAKAYKKWTRTASLSWEVVEIDTNHYYKCVAKGEFLLRLKKQSPLTAGQSFHLGIFHRCRHQETDAVEAVNQHFYEIKEVTEAYYSLRAQQGESFVKVGPASLIKRAFDQYYERYQSCLSRSSVVKQLRAFYGENWEFPKQLSVIGQADQSGHIGLIYMDGNRMNKVLQTLQTVESYQQFSIGLQNAIDRALVETITQLYPRGQLPKLANEDEDEQKGQPSEASVLPVEFVLAAGDDLIVIVPATKAMTFAEKFIEAFGVYANKLIDGQAECLTMSAGVAIAKSSFPIKYLVPFAEQLLKSAKKKHYERRLQGESSLERLATIDYMVVSMSSNPDLATIRQEQLKKNEEDIDYELTVRPFDLATWKSLRQLVAQVKRHRPRFPSSKMKQLYHLHFMERWEGEYYFQKLFMNLSDFHKQSLRQLYSLVGQGIFPSFWYQKEEGVYASPLLDFLEIYPFIDEAENVLVGEKGGNGC
ncbi:hypothetical protein [Geobacillus sp. C56-T2]|uniref:Cas10/Cmr2 second palm domain-containing protein n=1 Tax=Geobacillus sp. C56-T2 TaxID=600773 RepID=UPI0011AA95D0|nr:hypothetical protein [Geobacillus sp. C56-T2]NNV06825.1 hypothetical protein [Geobacillus sp. MMMUD3]TWG30827.1 hypothetical protein GC56T2_2009 [Geobacillus sp. C56-T2]